MFLLAVTHFIPRGWHRGQGQHPHWGAAPAMSAGASRAHWRAKRWTDRAHSNSSCPGQPGALRPLQSSALLAAFRLTVPPSTEPRPGPASPRRRSGAFWCRPQRLEVLAAGGTAPRRNGRHRGPQARSGPAQASRDGQGLADTSAPSGRRLSPPPAKMVPPCTHAAGQPARHRADPCAPSRPCHSGPSPHPRWGGGDGRMTPGHRLPIERGSQAEPLSPARRARAPPCTGRASTAAGQETRSCQYEWWDSPHVALPGLPKLKSPPPHQPSAARLSSACPSPQDSGGSRARQQAPQLPPCPQPCGLQACGEPGGQRSPAGAAGPC